MSSQARAERSNETKGAKAGLKTIVSPNNPRSFFSSQSNMQQQSVPLFPTSFSTSGMYHGNQHPCASRYYSLLAARANHLQQQERILRNCGYFRQAQQQQFHQPIIGPNTPRPGNVYSAASAMSRQMVMESASALCAYANEINFGRSEAPMQSSLGSAMHVIGRRSCVEKDTRCDPDLNCGQESFPSGMSSGRSKNETNQINVSKHASKQGLVKCDEGKVSIPESQHVAKRDSVDTVQVRSKNSKDKDKNVKSEILEVDQDQDLDTVDKPEPPKRQLSAYNLFFKHERARLLILSERGEALEDHPPTKLQAEDVRELLQNNPYYTDRTKRRHRKSHGKVSFMDLVKHVAQSWKTADKTTRAAFEEVAKDDKERYKMEWKEYKLKLKKTKKESKRPLADISSKDMTKLSKRCKITGEEENTKPSLPFKTSSQATTTEAFSTGDTDDILKEALQVTLSPATLLPSSFPGPEPSNQGDGWYSHEHVKNLLSVKIEQQAPESQPLASEGDLVDIAKALDSDFLKKLDSFDML